MEEREAQVFDEEAAMAHVKKDGAVTGSHAAHPAGCPSAKMMDFGAAQPAPAGRPPSAERMTASASDWKGAKSARWRSHAGTPTLMGAGAACR